MFTFYGDVSGSTNTPVLTAAGFIATPQQWIKLERRWKQIMTEYGVNELHMKDYAHSRGEYQSWNGQEDRRRKFLSALIGEIAPRVRHSFASSVYIPHYKEVDAKYGLREVVSPLALAGCTIVAKVFRWAEYHSISRSEIAFIFEDGDVDKGDFMDRCKRVYGFFPHFPKEGRIIRLPSRRSSCL